MRWKGRKQSGNVEDRRVFARAGRTYEPPTLVLFRDEVQSGCGVAGAATGPI